MTEQSQRRKEETPHEDLDPEHRRDTDETPVVKYLIGFIFVMFGMGWASIPLYRLVCRQIDPGGSTSLTSGKAAAKNVEVDKSRTVRVRFQTNVMDDLPWSFATDTRHVTVHPGEKKLVEFEVTNENVEHAITGKAVYDMNPPEAAPHFKKIECFCFTQQTLQPGQTRKMPLYFWLSPDLPKHVDDITLGYTFFNATSSRKRAERNDGPPARTN